MKLTQYQASDRVPGTQQSTQSTVREWVCPECEYFEEADDVEN
ncbi:MAG TPA: hypothetical protein VIY56_16090 [Vicinamibacterales bacterium]